MTSTEVFQICNTLVLPAWIILIIFPAWKWRSMTITIACTLLAMIYAFYVLTGLPAFDPTLFGSLAGVKQLFTEDEVLLAGWVHYLAFDLLIGNWIIDQSKKHNIRHLWIIPSLFLCFMFGPLGYLLFVFIRTYKTKSLA